MKRSLTLITALLMVSSAESWGKAPMPVDQPNHYADSPFNVDQGWYVSESLLVWHPYEDGLDFGSKYKSADGQSTKMKVESPDFDWGTGARLTFGRYLPNHQLWDISLATTYFYAKAEHTASANLSDGQFIVSALQSSLLGQEVSKAKSRWQLNYFLWDLDVGRSYMMTPKIVVHPYLGLRSTLMYVDFSNHNTNTYQGTVINPEFTGSNTLWGMGAKVGTDFTFKFFTNWSFLGNLSTSLLYSHFDLDQSFNGFIATTPVKIHTDKTYNALTSNIEASFGLGWERWVRNNTVRIATSFLFEASQWFNVNRLFHLQTGAQTFGNTTLPISTPEYNRGDLGLIGFSINLQVDF